jgi:cell division protein FtsB
LFLGTAALIMVALVLMATVIPFRQIVDQQNRLDNARTQLIAVLAENDILSQEVAVLDTPAEIERLAREKLGYVMPGETAYVILDPPDSEILVDSVPEAGPQPIPWYRAIWNFFTGADLTGHQSQG